MGISHPHRFEAETQPSETCSTLSDSAVARPLAPEDIDRGDFVAVLDEMHEMPSYYWHGDVTMYPPDMPIRVRLLPTDELKPLVVESVCLPFVLTRQPTGEPRTLDVRRIRLARLDARFGNLAWEAYRQQPPATES